MIGHGEPASGVCTIIRAIDNIVSMSSDSVLHLRSLNEHITSIIRMRPILMVKLRARRVKGNVYESHEMANKPLVSISAFAFQGTNAHVIVAQCIKDEYPGYGPIFLRYSAFSSSLWKFRQLWLPPMHPLLTKVEVKYNPNEYIRYLAYIDSTASQSYLFDHCVNGRPLFPATGFLELATAAARGTGSTEPGAIRKVVIPSPLLLKMKNCCASRTYNRRRREDVVAICDIEIRGNVTVSTYGRDRVHARGDFTTTRSSHSLPTSFTSIIMFSSFTN
jgi:hypothetical protein